MTNGMRRIANEFGVRPWWVQSVAVEYLDCRDYATDKGIWQFNFDRLDEDTIRQAVNTHRVVVRSMLYHNVQSGNVAGAFSRIEAGGHVARFSEEPDDIIPEGRASSFWYAMPGWNPLDTEDPKLVFSWCFQVYDEGSIWQWRFADMDLRSNRWHSEVVDLSGINAVSERLALLNANRVRPGQSGHDEYARAVANFYRWVEDVRRPVREQLWALHAKKRTERVDYPKAVNVSPPLLSHLETFTIKDGEFHTTFHAERVFYRSCLQHIRCAQDSVPVSGEWAATRLDRVFQERIEAVISAAACLEALVNRIGRGRHERLWRDVERNLRTPAKWHLILKLAGKAAEYDTARQPYQTLVLLFAKRNSLMHYKPQPEKVDRSDNGLARTAMQQLLPDEFVNELAGRLRSLIEHLHSAVGDSRPDWVEPGMGWIEPNELPVSNPRPMPQPPKEPKDYVTRVEVTLGPVRTEESSRKVKRDAE